MLTVIFGAGASYDSDPDNSSLNLSSLNEHRPPLAKNLFDTRYGYLVQRNPDASALIAQLRRAARNNPSSVEEELEAVTADLPYYSPAYRQLLALRHYLHDVIEIAQGEWLNRFIHGVSTYQEFLNEVNKWQVRTGQQVSLITFNYDTLLDTAFESIIGFKLHDMSSYVDNNTAYKLFKVHGSIDWYRQVERVLDDNILVSAHKLMWTGQYYTKRQNRPSIMGTGYVPALAIPTVTKKSFEFPDPHLEKMKAAIRETRYLLIIGWRGAEQHFTEIWKKEFERKGLRKIGIVSSKQRGPEEPCHRLIRDAKLYFDTITDFGNGFSEFVPHGLKSFLPTE